MVGDHAYLYKFKVLVRKSDGGMLFLFSFMCTLPNGLHQTWIL